MVKEKVLKIINEIDNIAVILSIYSYKGEDYSHELMAELKENVLNFLFDKDFEVELSWTSYDEALLILRFNESHSSLEINEHWECYHIVREFNILEIRLNYHDYYKLYGIGYDSTILEFNKQEKIDYLKELQNAENAIRVKFNDKC